MSQLPKSQERLPLLGRVLPVALRERVFEPAYYDLLATHAVDFENRSPLFALRVVGLALDTVRVGWLRLAWAAFRRSRRLQVAVTVATIAIVGFLISLVGASNGTTTLYGP